MVASGSAPSQRPLVPGTAPRLIVPSGQRGAGGARRAGTLPRPCALAVVAHNIVSAQTRKRFTGLHHHERWLQGYTQVQTFFDHDPDMPTRIAPVIGGEDGAGVLENSPFTTT